MADLYKRLRKLGFDSGFIRSALLPDWWEDNLAEVPFNRALAEMSIARQLELSLESLRDRHAALALPPMPAVRLKSATRDSSVCRIRPAIHVARRAADLICRAAANVPPFSAPNTAHEVRSAVLSRGAPVTLSTLVGFCWDHGIPVAHLSRLPQPPGFRKFDGIVLFVDERPCVLLAEAKDCPPMLAFHLAHELGHLLLGHVSPGSEMIADDNLERIVTDDVEEAADQFAAEILTGTPNPELRAVYGLTGPKLAAKARELGHRISVDAGIITLIYGRTADRWPAATNALKLMRLDCGARHVIHRTLAAHLDLDRLTESDRGFLEALALPVPQLELADGLVP